VRFAGVAALLLAIGLPAASRADEALELRAPPLLVDAGIGFGIEPHTRQPIACSRTTSVQGGGAMDVPVPQCNMVLTYAIGGEALWRGLVGAAAELVAAQGSPIQPGADANNKPIPAYGDRISIVLAAAVRPFAPLAWHHSGWWRRLAAGFGVQVGLSVEHTRVTLDSQTNAGLHLQAHLDVPLWRANTERGLSLRLAVRVLVSPEVVFQLGKDASVDEPGTAAQLFAGFTYYL
jgi:hypothetical protein